MYSHGVASLEASVTERLGGKPNYLLEIKRAARLSEAAQRAQRCALEAERGELEGKLQSQADVAAELEQIRFAVLAIDGDRTASICV